MFEKCLRSVYRAATAVLGLHRNYERMPRQFPKDRPHTCVFMNVTSLLVFEGCLITVFEKCLRFVVGRVWRVVILGLIWKPGKYALCKHWICFESIGKECLEHACKNNAQKHVTTCKHHLLTPGWPPWQEKDPGPSAIMIFKRAAGAHRFREGAATLFGVPPLNLNATQ